MLVTQQYSLNCTPVTRRNSLATARCAIRLDNRADLCCPVAERDSLALAQLCNGTASYCPVGQQDSLDLARLRNRTASYCPVGQWDSLDLARLRNGTAANLPGCILGLTRCVTGYREFGVVHPDSQIHNGAPRNWTSWVQSIALAFEHCVFACGHCITPFSNEELHGHLQNPPFKCFV